MKLRNKKTGEIGNLEYHGLEDERIWVWIDNTSKPEYRYDSLTELNEEWEDYEEIEKFKIKEFNDISVGIAFKNKEEKDTFVENLKAWKRLKNYYIKFKLDFVKNTIHFTYRIDGTLHSLVNEERIIFEDMKTIFGDEE